MMSKKKFKTKSFATFTVSWFFLILAFSGTIIYFTPSGRIANATNWTFWGLTKTEWQGIHVVFTVLFVLFIVLHLFFNWKVLMSYLKNKSSAGIHLKNEFVFATAIAGFFLIITLVKWQPVWILIEWREGIKNNENLVTRSPTFNQSEEQNQPEHDQRKQLGSGLGYKTVKELCSEAGITVEKGIVNLKKNGINAESNDRVRYLADKYNKRPSEITNYIGKNEN